MLLISLLVSVFVSQGKSVQLDAYNSDRGPRNDSKPQQASVPKDESVIVQSATVPQKDPLQSSETVVRNRLKNPSDDESEDTSSSSSSSSEEEEEPEGPPDHVIPYSDHEESRNVPTKPKYVAPGDWAKVPKDKKIDLEFVPRKVYAQVRKIDTYRKLPRKKAIENAESDEEKANAARLREVVRNTKVNTVYTEEGYEDSAYDHAGHVRDADFKEGYDRKLHDQLDVRRKSENDDDDDDDESESKRSTKKSGKHEKVRFEEIEEQDNSDRYETSTKIDDNGFVNPKFVAEKGTEKLQKDIEREAEELEKGIEISKLGKVRVKSGREVLAESRKRDDYKRKNNRRRKMNEDDATDRGLEVTTLRKSLENWTEQSLEPYRYEVEGNSSSDVDSINLKGIGEEPTTISYSQLFWNYFKTKMENQVTTTELPLILESTTLSPNNLQASLGVGNLLPYSVYQGITTSPPTIESGIFNAPPIVHDQTRSQIDSEYSKINGQDNQLLPLDDANTNKFWQSINSNEGFTTQASFILGQEGTLFSNTQRNLDDTEQVNKNDFDGSPFNPALNSFNFNRKPRYKITIRHKPKESNFESSKKQKSSNTVDERVIDPAMPKIASMNENYIKVLMHVRNEDKLKNQQRSKLLFPSNDKIKELREMRPPLPPQKIPPKNRYHNFDSGNRHEINAKHVEWSPFPRASSSKNLKTRIHDDSPQRFPFDRKGNPFDLARIFPSLRNDPIWRKESTDYASRDAGNRSGRAKNSKARHFGQASSQNGGGGIRGKRRERRFAEEGDDESGMVVKGGSMASDGVSNRGEIERGGKNSWNERNWPQKVIPLVELGVGPALNKWRVERLEEKKSRHDDGEGSRAMERESGARGEGVKGRKGDSRAFVYDDERKKGNATDLARRKKNFETKINGSLNESLDVQGNTNFRLNENGGESSATKVKREVKPLDDESNAKIGLKERRELLDGMSKDEQLLHETSKMKEKLKEHAELLDKAPKVVEDVVNEEINARFNEETGKQRGNEGKFVEVEIPEFDYVEELTEDEDNDEATTTTEATLDEEKYPFYKNEQIPIASALKYAIDPKRVPTKTYGAMEFYNSRDNYKHCDEIEANLNVLPKREEPVADRGTEEDLPRLRGLGDKLDCFKSKYFDENPFDNPLFLEKEVEDPVPVAEIDPKQFASRIMMFPKENDEFVIQKPSRRPENYRQPRKQGYTTSRNQMRARTRYNGYPMGRGGTRKRPRDYSAQSSRIKYAKGSINVRSGNWGMGKKNTEKNRVVASSSKISSLYTPYQNQVYEDVMGTIKNLANSYQVYEVTTIPGASQDEITVNEDVKNDDVKNSSANSSAKSSTNRKRKEKSGAFTNPVDNRLNNFNMKNNKESMIPKYRNRQRGVYKRTRVPQKGRPRVQQMYKPVIRTVKRKIRIYKRDLTDASEEKFREDERETSSSRENYYSRANSTNRNDQDFREDSNLGSAVSSDSRRKATRNNDREKPEKVVYTINDRIRYSKRKGEIRRVGKFGNKTKTVDGRRREPRYNYIRKSIPPNEISITTENSSSSLNDKINSRETSTERIVEFGNQEIAKESREAPYSIDEAKNDHVNISESLDHSKRDSINGSNEQIPNETKNGYAVHENVNEDETTTTLSPTRTSSSFFELKSFLETEPSKYVGSSSEDFKIPYSFNNSNDFGMNSNGTGNEKGKEDTSNTFPPSFFSNEESSEREETITRLESSTESSEENSAPSNESVSEEDRTFFSYASRPSSPAENFEDEKYRDLGPRVNKPAFIHPPFPDYKRSKGPRRSSEETGGSGEEKEEYVFPWYRDKEDERRKKRNRGKSNGEYEYPWERRERLAREERRRKEGRRGKGFMKRFDDDDDEEESEGISATTRRRNVHPRGRYRFWDRRDTVGGGLYPDNAGSSSENQPIVKYSSRYSAERLPLDKRSSSNGTTNAEEISRSIKKILEDDSGERKKEENDSSMEKILVTKPRKISKGAIVPGNVTLASSRKTKDKKKSKTVTNSAGASFESRNSNGSGITVVKSRGNENSTKRGSKKRRRPLSKIVIPTVETTMKTATEADRARRRQKSTTVAKSISSMSTASPPRIARGRNQRSDKDVKGNGGSNVLNKPVNGVNDVDTSRSKTGAVGHRFKGRKRGRANEITNETKDKGELSSVKSVKKQERSEKVDVNIKKEDSKNQDLKNDTMGEESIDGETKEKKEGVESKTMFPFVKSDERFDFRDERIDSLSDFDKSDNEDEFESASDSNFTPQNGTVQMTEQGSSEIVSSASWISENYDF